MRALCRLTLGVVILCAAAPSLAGGGVALQEPVLERVSAPPLLNRPLPQRVRVSFRGASVPTDVHVCESWECDLYRTYRVGSSVDEAAVVNLYLPTGTAWHGAFQDASTRSTQTSGGAITTGSNVVALVGSFPDGAFPAATLTRAGAEHPSGGVTPVDATALLHEEPDQALAFAAVAIAPGVTLDEGLEAALDRLVAMGGVVLLPMSLKSTLIAGEGQAVVVDGEARLVEIGSQRVLADGPRAADGRVYRRGGVVVTYEETALSSSRLSDLLLAAVPKLVRPPSAVDGDPRQSPAAGAAAIAASRTAHPGLLFLPVAVMLLLALVAVRARRQKGALITPTLVVGSLLSTVVLLAAPRLLDGGRAQTAARAYTIVGHSAVALEEGALASRPRWSGGHVTLTAPVGAIPLAKVEGIKAAGKQALDVTDQGRTLGLDVPGDGVAVAAWARVVPLEEGLHVEMPGGVWPQSVADVVVENRLPFTLDHVIVVRMNGGVDVGGAVASGERLSSWTPADDDSSPPFTDANDARALAKRHLLSGLQSRCYRFDHHYGTPTCVVGVGEAADGTLVGVQVSAP